MFLPYCIYLISFVLLASNFAGELLDRIGDDEESESVKIYRSIAVILSLIIVPLWIYFTRNEVIQINNAGFYYFLDYWNLFDVVSLLLNLIFIGMLLGSIFSEDPIDIVFKHSVRTVGALACWILWVKMFYWMRLFRASAYFVTLISRTIWDVRIFLGLIGLILVAYANFFFIIQNNVKEEEDFHYVDSYVGIPVFDSLISMYLLSLGEFDLDGYQEGPDKFISWIFFMSGSFIILIVFMNMLIAIMGDTFGQVQEIQEESSLQEMLLLIEDNIFLIDLASKFENKKYIIKVNPDTSLNEDNEVSISDEIINLAQNITRKSEYQQENLLKRLDNLERTHRSMLKTQAAKVLDIQRHLQAEKIEKEKNQKKESY